MVLLQIHCQKAFLHIRANTHIWVMAATGYFPLLWYKDVIMAAIRRNIERRTGKLVPLRSPVPRTTMRESPRIPFHVQRGTVFINPERVTHLQAQSNYTMIHQTVGKSILVSKTLKYCAGMFPGHFLRVHQSYLINPTFLAFYDRAEHAVELDNGVRVPVSRSGKAALR